MPYDVRANGPLDTNRGAKLLFAAEERSMTDKASVTLPGTVEKIIPPIAPELPEKAQIRVDGAEHLYQEIRIENTLQDEAGNTVAVKKGAEVEVTIEAAPDATTNKERVRRRKRLTQNMTQTTIFF